MTVFVNPNLPTEVPTEAVGFRSFVRTLLANLTTMKNNLVRILDRGISFDDNIDCVFVTYTSAGSFETEDVVPHTLGKIPTGIVLIDVDKAYAWYKTQPHTKTDLYIAWAGSSITATFMVF